MSSNLDPLTETHDLTFYLQHYVVCSDYVFTAESPSGEVIGYAMARPEGTNEEFRARLRTFAVVHDYRRLGIATALLKRIEDFAEHDKCFFMDLLVPESNSAAVQTLLNSDFIVYRNILNYFQNEFYVENALEMRKALSADVEQLSIIPFLGDSYPEELEAD